MPFELSSDVVACMLAEAQRAHPLECCGVLLGSDDGVTGSLPARNVHPDPARHFEIDPQVLIDAHRAARSGGPRVVGYYHSHPNGLARPSATDSALAANDGAIWAIIAVGRITLWRDWSRRVPPGKLRMRERLTKMSDTISIVDGFPIGQKFSQALVKLLPLSQG